MMGGVQLSARTINNLPSCACVSHARGLTAGRRFIPTVMTELTTKEELDKEGQTPCECCGKPTQVISFSPPCHEAPFLAEYDIASGEIRLVCLECEEVTHRFKIQDLSYRN